MSKNARLSAMREHENSKARALVLETDALPPMQFSHALGGRRMIAAVAVESLDIVDLPGVVIEMPGWDEGEFRE